MVCIAKQKLQVYGNMLPGSISVLGKYLNQSPRLLPEQSTLKSQRMLLNWCTQKLK